jgi:hypothetical protein
VFEICADLGGPEGVGSLGWTQHSVAGLVVVRLAGDLDLSTASQFGWQLRELTGTTIVLDLSEVVPEVYTARRDSDVKGVPR